jgi:hypothetical protein
MKLENFCKKGLWFLLITSVGLAAGACGGGAPNDERPEQTFEATAGGTVEAWLVDGVAGLRFDRVTRPSPFDAPQAGCTSTFATNVELFVVASEVSSSSFSLGVTTSVATPFGTQSGPSFGVGGEAFATEVFRPGSGERLKTAPGAEFEIGRSCQGIALRYTQTAELLQGGGAARRSVTRLANVISLPADAMLFPQTSCVVDAAATNATGVKVERCSAGKRDPRDGGYDELRVRVRGSARPGDVSDLRHGRAYRAWVSLNGEQRTLPAACRADVEGSTAVWTCALTLTTGLKAFAYDDEGYAVEPGLFRWARRDGAAVVNAWDVQFALVDDEGVWVRAPDGGDFRARVEERTTFPAGG